jgi:HD-like signal output (HDOD) protein
MAETAGTTPVHERLRGLVERVQGLPTLPSILHKLNQMILNPKTSAKEVSEVISSDPSLTSKVLRMANSPFYGFQSRITTITHANVILGFNTIKSIIMSSTIFDVFGRSGKSGALDRTELWKHSIGCGAAAKVIGHRLNYRVLEELLIAGLLHDVGKIILDQFFPDKYAEVLNLVRSKDLRIVEAEVQVLGVTHADVGGWLLERWNLPKGLVETTRCHHNPALASDSRKIAEIIHIADILVRAIRFGNGGDTKIPVLDERAWKSLGLNETELEELLFQTGEEIERAMALIDIVR